MVSITWVKKMELDFELWRALFGWSGEPNKTLSNVHVQLPLMQSLLKSYQSCNLILQKVYVYDNMTSIIRDAIFIDEVISVPYTFL